MFSIEVVEKTALLKVCLNGVPCPGELRRLLDAIEVTRGQFGDGYRLWLALPDGGRQVSFEEVGKLDLTMYEARRQGLREVVIETAGETPLCQQVAALLEGLYRSLRVPVTVVSDTVMAKKTLNLLWHG
ncbi:hypothetical protein IGB42_03146 [Andreprevotia sp. IGB-42]|uniref:hypothetical protein n=1 Tax=Andreprevotia sp. IGB-42 TaxID=2497473 RepID=UPI001357248F|nr:hypothetical protein [Andreprevotia sp. IGB-42]KAF0812477.1 hypothetical protein IGB42_03146 [Andreprevotia sp. IGB-42]